MLSRLNSVSHRIKITCLQNNRTENSVRLLIVSKKQSVDKIRSLFKFGQIDFGENYLQEALGKISQLKNYDICWHFIGAIQSNKTRYIAENFDWVHTVSRIKIAKNLSKFANLANREINVCIQVNISSDADKSGCCPSEILTLAHKIQSLPNLTLRGLMAIPKKSDAQAFDNLSQLFNQLKTDGFALDTLSMGISDDLELAIGSGSTLLRIGRAIFGERH